MKKLLLSLLLALVVATPAMAQTYEEGYREKSPSGHWYRDDTSKNIILVCGEKYITNTENYKVSCLSELAQKRVDAWMSKLVKVGTTFVRK